MTAEPSLLELFLSKIENKKIKIMRKAMVVSIERTGIKNQENNRLSPFLDEMYFRSPYLIMLKFSHVQNLRSESLIGNKMNGPIKKLDYHTAV